MTAVTTVYRAGTALPFARPLTRADLQRLPDDDGHRYELLDGVLLVSPSPSPRHQRAVGELYLLLRQSCPAGLEVLFAPLAVALADDTELQPDVLVAERSRFTDRELPGAPLLAVEVLSPSTRRVDLLLKRDRLQEAGCPAYWLVDPLTPSITVLQLEDGVLVERGSATGEGRVELTQPWPITVVPADLVR